MSAGVAAIVVSFHRPVQLARALAALAEESLHVVVVNVEADPEVAAVAAAAGRRCLDLAGNVGYAAAVNLGVAAVNQGVTVFMNDDVIVEAAVVHALAAQVDAGLADIVVPAVRGPDGRIERTIAAPPTVGRLLLEWCCLPDAPVPGLRRVLPVEKWRLPRGPERIAAAAAVIVATSTEVLRAHPLPEAYFLYWEEAEWFLLLARAGRTAAYDPGLRVLHAGGRDDVRPEKSALLARNAVRVVRRTAGRRAAVLAWVVVVMWQLRLVAVDGLRAVRGGAGSRERLTARRAGLRSALSAWDLIR